MIEKITIKDLMTDDIILVSGRKRVVTRVSDYGNLSHSHHVALRYSSDASLAGEVQGLWVSHAEPILRVVEEVGLVA